MNQQSKLDQVLGRTLQYISWSWQYRAWLMYKEMVMANRKAKTK